jgi:hypothetical protein
MTYTLWSRGRLLGESPLDFVRCIPKLRVGFLHPTGEADEPGRECASSSDEQTDTWNDSDGAELTEEQLIAELEALSVEDAADLAWRPPREERQWMRYQLQVELIHDWSIP